MATVYEAADWQQHVMEWQKPHKQLEPLEPEIKVVAEALAALVKAGILPHDAYDHAKMLAHRAAVRDNFDIPWTAITPRMQRLLYAINAIAQPRVMIAVGIFCGNTFISNAGAATGPGACYAADRLVGIEIRPEEADRARRNVAALEGGPEAEIIAADGIPWLREFDGVIDLLYLDADGRSSGQGKSIYLDLVQAALPALRPGSLVLAHNSINSATELADYLEFMRDPAKFRNSMNMMLDNQGLEVSVK